MRRNLPLWLIISACIAPVLASYATYYWLTPHRQANYGELLHPVAAINVRGQTVDGKSVQLDAFQGKWILLTVDQAPCEQTCREKLHAMRQAHALTGKDKNRIERVWAISDHQPAAADLLAQHPGLFILRIPQEGVADLPSTANSLGQHVYLIDPLGNGVLRYTMPIDIKRLHKDLTRLLRASRIG